MQVASYVAQATCHLQTCILANLLSVFAPLREIFIGIGARPRVAPVIKNGLVGEDQPAGGSVLALAQAFHEPLPFFFDDRFVQFFVEGFGFAQGLART